MTVTVTAKDYSLALSTKSAAIGNVTFSVKNSGKHDHNFQINGKKTSAIEAREEREAHRLVQRRPAPSPTSSTVGDDAKQGHEGHVHARRRTATSARQEGLRLDRVRRVPP